MAKKLSLIFLVLFGAFSIFSPLQAGEKGKEELLSAWVNSHLTSQPFPSRDFQRLKNLYQKPPLPKIKELLQKKSSPSFPHGLVTSTLPTGEAVSYYFPPNLSSSEQAPLLIAFHDRRESALSALSKWKKVAKAWGAVLLLPSSQEGDWWAESPTLISHLLSYTSRHYSIDHNRIFLLGENSGGSGALYYGLRQPHYFAGIIAVNAIPRLANGRLDKGRIPHLALPLLLFETIPPSTSLELIWKKMEKENSSFHRKKVKEFTPAKSPKILSFLKKRRRPPYPLNFSFRIDRQPFARLYYLQLSLQGQGVKGKLSFEVRKKKIILQGENLGQGRIYIPPSVLPLARTFSLFINGKKVFSGPPYKCKWKDLGRQIRRARGDSRQIFSHYIDFRTFQLSSRQGPLHYPQPEKRWKMVRKIRLEGLKEHLPQLRILLRQDPHPEVRAETAIALGKLTNSPLELARALRQDTSPLVRQSALRALSFGQGKKYLLPFLMIGISDRAPAVRAESLRLVFPDHKSPQLSRLLTLASRDSSSLVRKECASALGTVNIPERFSLLRFLLSDSDWTVRERVASALGEIGDKEALDLLEIASQDSHGQVRKRVKVSRRQVKLRLRGIDPMEIALLHRKAGRWIQKKKWKKARQTYLELLEKDPEDPTALYNLACVEARLEETERAIFYLIAALLSGFDEYSLVKKDPDLEPLRKLSQYKKIEKAIKKNEIQSLAKLLPRNKIDKLKGKKEEGDRPSKSSKSPEKKSSSKEEEKKKGKKDPQKDDEKDDEIY